MKNKLKIVSHLPNIISILRILGIAVFVGLFYCPVPYIRVFASPFFILLALTDLVDGWLARKLKVESDFGALLDPLADKLLVTAALIIMSTRPEYKLPAWVAILLISRDMYVTGLRGMLSAKGIILKASIVAKWKTTTIMLAITILLLLPLPCSKCYVVESAGQFFLWLAVALSLFSAIQYSIQSWKP